MTEENKDIQDKNADAASVRDVKESSADASEKNSDHEKSDGPGASTKGDDNQAERIARLEGENSELRDKLLRSIAEMENIRRRTEREKADISKYAITKFAGDILSVSDNIRRAIEAAPKDAADPAFRSLAEGVEMTERELTNVLERHGIKRIDPLKEKFDPNFHQAMFEEESLDVPPGNVVRVMQAGFMIEDRLLRPAMVSVAKAWTGPIPDKPAAEEPSAKTEPPSKTERAAEPQKDHEPASSGSASIREAKPQPQSQGFGPTRPEWTAPRPARPNPSRPTVTELRRPSAEGSTRSRVSVDPAPFSATQRPAQQPSSGPSSSRTSTLHQPVIPPSRPGPRRSGGGD